MSENQLNYCFKSKYIQKYYIVVNTSCGLLEIRHMWTVFSQHFDLSVIVDNEIVFNTHSYAFEFRFNDMTFMKI